ncbi:hypothetical protein HBI56_091840 [Parastagonospora nodorum]|uniref:RRM domain-containing protein n=1 Tax=Phaeosphaeria nodorum (strain SN15 / ATCC MYA-4574 / FGSC 10173) TaxID=321614 RepID=Q0TVC9_PHANO|nr:hypothetical protein SNOG_16535 [Parastagonospora nodorum SN15]KAH3914276.1 hypothetical protein HBH56_086930 [Parastagonospora nodorum]EAT76075.2 hypothetical protein SNOG_16535 [Parastagonospora nodorum SN15]KAH3921205.1 hypothetical protein HBH54_243750 [Parastagonospora nodorum]KAH3945795.1 hypothetical protein HBH53_138990 [Parastagonospora nodorum]KAH3956751.1 hypothetical protein HBH51_236330 [Parastagonospora nodorum]
MEIRFLLRRAAVRAVSATPAKAFLAKPRSIATFTPSTLRTHKQQWSAAFQRRFASDDATKNNAPENFAQTAAEPPMEDGLTPAQQDAQADPTDAKATITPDTLGQVEDAARNAERRPRRSRENNTPPHNTLYIGNLYYEVTTEQLQKVFSRFGEVASVKIVYDNRGMSRGFGYVEFKSIDDAQTAIDNLDMQVFEGRNLVVQYHRAKSDSDRPKREFPPANLPSKTLFIGNMSFEMSDKDLNDLFRDIRNVNDVRVAIDRRTGQPRGFAHADFLDVASATKAKEILSAKTIYGRELRVDFSRSANENPRGNTRRDSGTREE